MPQHKTRFWWCTWQSYTRVLICHRWLIRVVLSLMLICLFVLCFVRVYQTEVVVTPDTGPFFSLVSPCQSSQPNHPLVMNFTESVAYRQDLVPQSWRIARGNVWAFGLMIPVAVAVLSGLLRYCFGVSKQFWWFYLGFTSLCMSFSFILPLYLSTPQGTYGFEKMIYVHFWHVFSEKEWYQLQLLHASCWPYMYSFHMESTNQIYIQAPFNPVATPFLEREQKGLANFVAIIGSMMSLTSVCGLVLDYVLTRQIETIKEKESRMLTPPEQVQVPLLVSVQAEDVGDVELSITRNDPETEQPTLNDRTNISLLLSNSLVPS